MIGCEAHSPGIPCTAVQSAVYDRNTNDYEAHLVLPPGQQLVLSAGDLGPPQHGAEHVLVKDCGSVPHLAHDDVVLKHVLCTECSQREGGGGGNSINSSSFRLTDEQSRVKARV